MRRTHQWGHDPLYSGLDFLCRPNRERLWAWLGRTELPNLYTMSLEYETVSVRLGLDWTYYLHTFRIFISVVYA